MPIVTINLIEGRTDDQKRALVKNVTQAVCDTLDKQPEAVRVILQDMAPIDYAVGGVTIADQS